MMQSVTGGCPCLPYGPMLVRASWVFPEPANAASGGAYGFFESACYLGYSDMEQEIINRELKHQLEINLSEIDTELGLLFKPHIFIDDEYRHFAEESPSRIVACKQWLLSGDNAMLEEAVRYANARVMAKETPMCYFYDAEKFDALEEMVVRVATAVRLQEFEQVDWDEQDQMDACTDADAVMKLLGCYVYFICLANRHWGPSRFDELFTHLWWAYWDNFKIEMSHFWEDAEYWRETWKGCLFFEK